MRMNLMAQMVGPILLMSFTVPSSAPLALKEFDPQLICKALRMQGVVLGHPQDRSMHALVERNNLGVLGLLFLTGIHSHAEVPLQDQRS